MAWVSSMGEERISPHFNRSEFECQCNCGFNTVDVELISILEEVRQYFMKPVTITSGCRCEEHNESIGGTPNSKHTLGQAADIKVSGVTAEKVYKFIDGIYPSKYGLGLYSSWVHIDPRLTKARWNK